jgi:hypothetical protein
MNNLVTTPFSVIIEALESKATNHVLEPGIHIFHDTSIEEEEQFPFYHLQDLYTSSVFVTEHDTHCGGDLETRELAELFKVNNNNTCVQVFFVLERKIKRVLLVLKWDSGNFDAFELLKVYERLRKDEINRVV